MIYYNYYQASSQQDSDKIRYEFVNVDTFQMDKELENLTQVLNQFFENNDYGDLTIDLYSEKLPAQFSSMQAYLDNHDLLLEKPLTYSHEQTADYLNVVEKRNEIHYQLLEWIVEELKHFPHAIVLETVKKSPKP